jgi:hypothetical protein
MRSVGNNALWIPTGWRPRKSGKTEAMAEITARPSPARRNWFAIAALWLVVASWLALAFRVLTGDIFGIESPLDWLYVTAVLGAIVLGAAGLVAIRTRGDGWLAVTAFVTSLLLPALYALVYLLVAVLFGGFEGDAGFVD